MKSTPEIPQLLEQAQALLKPYQTTNAEGIVISAIKYFEGQPRNVRFNGQTGRFSYDGKEDLGQSLEVVPLTWRFFTGSLFGREKARYAEIFYVDKQRNLCVVLLTNAAADNLKKFMADLSYGNLDGQVLTNTVVRISSALRIRKSDGQRYHVAEFENCGRADSRAVLAFRLFAMDYKVYRADTRPATVEDTLYCPTYFTMIGTGVRRGLPDSDEERAQIQESYL